MPSDELRAQILLADYLAADAAGKLNAIGLSWGYTPLDPQTGRTAAFCVAAVIDVPPRRLGQSFPVMVELRSEDGQVVSVATVGPQPEALRVQQLMKADRPNLPGADLPSDAWGRVQFVLNFPQGLPLIAGTGYFWRLSVDSRHVRS